MSNETYTNNSFINDDGRSVKESQHRSIELATKSSNGVQATDDYNPYDHREVEHPLSNNEAIVHLLKVALGTGIFAMPNAFNHTGYIMGFFGTIVLGSIATYCVHMLVNLHYELCKWKKVPSMSYPLVGEAALLSGPRYFRPYAPHMIHVINAFLVMYEVGACCIYVVFISANLRALINATFDIDINVRIVMAIILVPLILINWVRELKYLAPLSTIGNGIMLVSFGIICYYVFREPLTLEGKRTHGPLAEFPMFFGTVLFALEAIGVIMPIENEMKKPKDFRGVTGILNRAMFLIVFMYVSIGLLGYLRYGTEVEATVTVNLPKDELLAQVAKGLIAFGVYVTHALALYVAIDITWTQYAQKRLEKSQHKLIWEYALRTALVFFTFVMAIAIPNLDLFISLVGALSLSMLGITFPAFLECIVKWNKTSGAAKAFMIFKNVIIALIGVAGFIIGTSLSIKDIIKEYID